MHHSILSVSAVALCAAALAAPALAASDHDSGDGTGSDNERLRPGIYPSAPVLENGDWLREPYDPLFDVDWSVALRGSYTKATQGERYDTIVAPSVTLTHQGTRSSATVNGSAEITRPSEGQIDVTGLRLGVEAGYAIDSVTTLSATGDFSLTQDVAGTPGVAADVSDPPQTWEKTLDFGVTRQFGKFNVGVTGGFSRFAYGPTGLSDGTSVDNSDQNLWSLDGGLRVGFQATPIIEVFGQADTSRDYFDTASTSLLVKTDATTNALRGGVTARWNSILEASGSLGISRRHFDVATIDETIAYLYDANIAFTPDPTFKLTGGFTTTVAPPGPSSAGTSRVEYGANATMDYTVNSWLRLRALADWKTATFTGSTDTESGHGFGFGADYAVNAHTDLNADYKYDFTKSTIDGNQEAHRVTVGITVSR